MPGQLSVRRLTGEGLIRKKLEEAQCPPPTTQRSEGEQDGGVGGDGQEMGREQEDGAEALIWGLVKEAERSGVLGVVTPMQSRTVRVLYDYQANEVLEDLRTRATDIRGERALAR